MLLVTNLDQPSVRDRVLNQDDRRILGPTIRVSENNDAQIVFNIVGQSGLQALADQVGMTPPGGAARPRLRAGCRSPC